MDDSLLGNSKVTGMRFVGGGELWSLKLARVSHPRLRNRPPCARDTPGFAKPLATPPFHSQSGRGKAFCLATCTVGTPLTLWSNWRALLCSRAFVRSTSTSSAMKRRTDHCVNGSGATARKRLRACAKPLRLSSWLSQFSHPRTPGEQANAVGASRSPCARGKDDQRAERRPCCAVRCPLKRPPTTLPLHNVSIGGGYHAAHPSILFRFLARLPDRHHASSQRHYSGL